MNQALNITQEVSNIASLVLKRMSCFMPPTWVFFPTKKFTTSISPLEGAEFFPRLTSLQTSRSASQYQALVGPPQDLRWALRFTQSFSGSNVTMSPQKSSQDLMIKTSVSFKKSRLIQEGAHCLAGLLGTELGEKNSLLRV